MDRALLLTDVVDSTRLAESLGDARIAELWVAHDRAVRDLLAAWRGLEVDRTDGFLALFERVSDAVGCGRAVHAALARVGERFGVSFAARVGIHWGSVVLIETSAADRARGAKPLELEGLAKPLAARVTSLGSPGQVLVTEDAVAALGLAPGPDRRVVGDGLVAVSHGHWQLKGVSHPIEVFEVGVPGEAPFVAPADAPKAWRVHRVDGGWVPVREVKRNLPTERDAFVGRGADLVALGRRMDDGARLVTVLGLGGTGKTRLVTRFAWAWLGEYPGGAWFCDLSEARGLDGLTGAVAAALDVPLGKGDPVAQVGHAVASRGACLVILDNFEQVARLAGPTLGRWLDLAPEARFLVTSREVLGLPGEQVLALAPLPRADAVDLFVARAVAASQDFVVTAADRQHVEALVVLLDGLPLAIELAAARVRVMPPLALLQRMSERFKLLASAGGRHTRQATLRGALDWSWDLLSADEQSALAQLSVFEGGFTLEAAERVLALAELWPVDAVQALVDKSLVRRVSEGRFDLLVTVHEYAAEKLEAAGVRSGTEARHGRHFATLGSAAAIGGLGARGGVERRRAMHADLDNLVAATRRSVARGDGEVAVATLLAAVTVLMSQGPFGAAVALTEEVLGLSTLSPRDRARAARALGKALAAVGRGNEALDRYDAALAVARELGDRRLEGQVLGNLGILHGQRGRLEEAIAIFSDALAIAREVGDRSSEAGELGNLGVLRMNQRRYEEARRYYEAALALHRELGDRRMEGQVLGNLGVLDTFQGRMEEARTQLDEALRVDRELGDRNGEGARLSQLGHLHVRQGRMEEALPYYEAALALHREVGDRVTECGVLGNLGPLNGALGRWDEARRHLEGALALARELGNRRFEGVVLGNLGTLAERLGRLEEARERYEAALAIHHEVGNRAEEALSRRALGMLDAGQGRPELARAHFDAGLEALGGTTAAVERVHLLLERASLLRAVDRRDEAWRDLDEAQAVAASAGIAADSELGRRLVELRAALEVS